jgi:aminomethyltransferase
LIDTDQSQLEKLLTIFDKYIIMDDVEVQNFSDQLTAIGVAGPNAGEVLKTAGIELPELEGLQFAELKWRDIQVTVVRGDNPSVESYEIWFVPDSVATVWDGFVKAGAKPAGTASLELLRIAAGIPRYGPDIRERDLAQETRQDRGLHFAKGCYVGQEIVERIRSRGAVHRQFAGFEIQANGGTVRLPAPGAKIQADGKDAGEITSVTLLPTAAGERAVALGYIRREVGAVGKLVSAGGTELTVSKLPFIERLTSGNT